MALRYILGNSGYGKTTYCIKEIIRAEEKGTKGIFIVPEQFTLEGERLLISSSSSKSIMNTQVLSFKRLAYRLSEELGSIPKTTLNTQAKTMILRKIVFALSDKLVYFNRVIDKPGFLEQLNLIIREFFQYNITPESLDEISVNIAHNDSLKNKLTDLSIIFKEYINYIQGYITDEHQLTLICNRIGQSNLIKGSEIWIDGFTGFTPQELSVIKQLLLAGNNVTISLITDLDNIYMDKIDVLDPFYEAKNTIKKLNTLAYEANVPIAEPIYLSKDMRHKKNKELAFFKKAYFSNKKYHKPVESIEINSCSTLYDETDLACEKIIELVKNHSYRFDHIAVIIGSEEYEIPLKNSFEKYNIPNFIDNKASVMAHPLTDFILSLFEIVMYNFSYKAVCKCMKSGMLDMEPLDIAMLENYILANGIKGYKWSYKQWEYKSEYNIDDINLFKDDFLSFIEPFTKHIKANKTYTVKEISIKLFNLLENIAVTSKLQTMTEQTGDKIHVRIWETLVSLFDTMVNILGEEQVTPKEYYKILLAGLNSCQIGFIPPTQDHIIVGDSIRTRLPEVKAMLVLGVNEGNLPKYTKDIGVLSDMERCSISQSGYELAPDNRQRLNLDRLAIYMTLAKPTEKLFLSYPTGNLNSERLRPSSIIYKFKAIYDIEEKNNNTAFSLAAAQITFEQLTLAISQLRSAESMPSTEFKEIYKWFAQNPLYAHKIQKLKTGILSDTPKEYLSDNAIKKIFSDKLLLSVSRLEKFGNCPFSYFMNYIIQARDREEYELFNPLSIGNIYHESLKSFSQDLQAIPNMDWSSITKTDIAKMVSECVDKTAIEHCSDITLDTGKFQYTLKRVKDTLSTSIWALSKHIKAGEFTPAAFELSFGINGDMPAICYNLDKDNKLYLNGKIDRVDLYNSNGKQYIKVIDYKTSVGYDLNKIYYGLDPQLILYLDALVKNQELKSNASLPQKNVLPINKDTAPIPAGMFYFGIDNPICDISNNIEQKLLEKFNMQGILLNDNNVKTAFEKEYNGKLKTLKASNLLDIEEFNALREHSVNIAKKYGNEILKGNVAVMPYKYMDKTGCNYCSFSTICRHETINKNTCYSYLPRLTAKEILQKITSSENDDNE